MAMYIDEFITTPFFLDYSGKQSRNQAKEKGEESLMFLTKLSEQFDRSYGRNLKYVYVFKKNAQL